MLKCHGSRSTSAQCSLFHLTTFHLTTNIQLILLIVIHTSNVSNNSAGLERGLVNPQLRVSNKSYT